MNSSYNPPSPIGAPPQQASAPPPGSNSPHYPPPPPGVPDSPHEKGEGNLKYQNPPPVYPVQGGYPQPGYHPQHGYPPQGYPPHAGYPPPGYPVQGGYPPPGYGYPPQYPQQYAPQYAHPPPQQNSSGFMNGMLGCIVLLLLDGCLLLNSNAWPNRARKTY